MLLTKKIFPTVLLALSINALQSAEVIEYFGYDDCIELKNSKTRVVLCPAMGGKVLEYSFEGRNALEVIESERGWLLENNPEKSVFSGGGRFDIGPEKIIPKRRELHHGRWQAEITGENSARLTSPEHEATGVQLVRDYSLDPESSKFVCTQTIRNISDRRLHWCHWSRTLGKGGGICVVPLSEETAYPKKYIMYIMANGNKTIDYQPEDPNVRVEGDYLIVSGAPQYPKLGMDSMEGWFSYLTTNDLVFVKKFPTYPNRRYNEITGMTICLWYVDNWRGSGFSTCELEPIGPREDIPPGGEASFTEEWFLGDYQFPEDRENVDTERVAAISKRLMGD